MPKRKMEDWEEEIIREAEAKSRMRKMLGNSAPLGAKISGAKNIRRTTPATLFHRDSMAKYTGKAKSRLE